MFLKSKLLMKKKNYTITFQINNLTYNILPVFFFSSLPFSLFHFHFSIPFLFQIQIERGTRTEFFNQKIKLFLIICPQSLSSLSFKIWFSSYRRICFRFNHLSYTITMYHIYVSIKWLFLSYLHAYFILNMNIFKILKP